MKTNVKKLVLVILLIVDIITLKYSNINLSQIYINDKNKTMIFLSNCKNIENKNEPQEKKSLAKNDSKEQCTSNKDIKGLKQYCEANKVNQENIQQVNAKQSNNQLSRGSNLGYDTDIVLTFYTSLPQENGGYTGINCTGKKLISGMVANNVLPLGTEIYTNEFGTLTVSDRGGNNFDTIHRLDVYIPRNNGENDREYIKRVNDMGKVTIKGCILKQ